jgi:hypothetical protein
MSIASLVSGSLISNRAKVDDKLDRCCDEAGIEAFGSDA